MLSDSLLILVISVFTALLGEGLTWLLVYRTEKYQKLKVEIERQTKKLEKKKEAHGDAALDRTQKRKMVHRISLFCQTISFNCICIIWT